jgi:nicotinamidase/pyrazinamidase
VPEVYHEGVSKWQTDGMAALIVVDVQRDFCPGGALPAPGGDRIIPEVNRAVAEAHARGMIVYASRDWHPPVTTHFREYGGPWPPHCVQGTDGAAFHPALALPADVIVISKGEDPEHPGYSAFDGHTPDDRTLLDDLRARGIDHLYVCGIATDYCVKETALDARRFGLRVTVLTDAITGIDAQPGDVERALQALADAGVEMMSGLAAAPARRTAGR